MHPIRKTAVIALTLLAAGPAALAAAAPPQPVGHELFADDFSAGLTADWSVFNREAPVSGGALQIDGGYLPDAVGRDGWVMTHIGDRSWRNYVYTATYDNSNVGGSPGDVHMASFYFRVAEQEPGEAIKTTYRLDIWAPGPAGNDLCGADGWSNGFLSVTRYVDGEATLLDYSCASNAVVGANSVRVKLAGSTIRVSSNGQQQVQVVDPAPIRSGGVGVGQIWETNGSFDDVRVAHGG